MKLFILLISMNLIASSFIPEQFEAELIKLTVSRLKKTVREPLRLKYKFPKNIAMYIESMTYICNSMTSWRYVPPFIEGEKGDVYIGKSSSHCFSELFDSLKHGLKENNIYDIKKDIKNLTISFIFKSGEKNNGVDSVDFIFNQALTEQLTLVDVKKMIIKYKANTQKPATYEIKKISANVKLASTDFIFVIPKNTKEIYLK